jgi:hypothetical protein
MTASGLRSRGPGIRGRIRPETTGPRPPYAQQGIQ